jgi:peptidyl-prolyl cis-trans isomerase C
MEKKKARLVKVVSISALTLLFGAVALNGWALNSKGEKEGVLATVDGVTITQGEVDERISAMLGGRAETLPPEQQHKIREQLGQNVLDNLIVEALLTKALEKENVMVSDTEIDKVLTHLKESLPADMKFEDYLTQLGMTENEMKQTVTKNLRIQKLVEQQLASVSAPVNGDIEAYYATHSEEFEMPERVDVRHIFIAVGPEDAQETKAQKMKQAEKIREQLTASQGKDFEKLAAEVSDCPSKAKGGKLGILSRGQAVKPFEDAAFNQKVGEVGPVVETQFGYHVIEVLDHMDASKAPLSEVKEKIAQRLTEQKKEQAFHSYIDSLKAAATIETNPDASKPSDPA